MQSWQCSQGTLDGLVRALPMVNRTIIRRAIFVGSCVLYWIWYDKGRHGYISRVYRKDKYGVVINYAMVSLSNVIGALYHHDDLMFIRCLDCCRIYTDISCDSIRTPESKLDAMLKRDPLKAYSESLEILSLRMEADKIQAAIGRDIRLYLLTTLPKIIVFNMIFKNNTSKKRAHQRIHKGLVIAMGVISAVPEALMFIARPERRWGIVRSAAVSAACAITFSFVGKHAEIYSKKLKTKRRAFKLLKAQEDLEIARGQYDEQTDEDYEEYEDYEEQEDEHEGLWEQGDHEEREDLSYKDPISTREKLIALSLNFITMFAEALLIAQSIN